MFSTRVIKSHKNTFDVQYIQYLEGCTVQCCWSVEKASWSDRVRIEEVLQRAKEERNILHAIKRKKANWIGHILHRICLLNHVTEGQIEGNIEVTWRRGRRRKLLDDFKGTRTYWKLKEEALDLTGRRTRFGRVYRRDVRRTMERRKE